MMQLKRIELHVNMFELFRSCIRKFSKVKYHLGT